MQTHFCDKSILAVGLGLIGASFIKALRVAGCRHIDGTDTDAKTLELALTDGLINAAYAPDTKQYDLVVCSVPHRAVAPVYRQVQDSLAEGGVFAELSGLKSNIVRTLCAAMQAHHVLLCLHPMAGSERSGYAHSDAALFTGAPLIITPTQNTNDKALSWADFFAGAIKCSQMLTLSPKRHDEVIATVSHLPHIAALALWESGRECERFSGGSFRAATRVANINAPLWAGLLSDNAEYLLQSLKQFRHNIDLLEQALRAGDSAALEAQLELMSKTGGTS